MRESDGPSPTEPAELDESAGINPAPSKKRGSAANRLVLAASAVLLLGTAGLVAAAVSNGLVNKDAPLTVVDATTPEALTPTSTSTPTPTTTATPTATPSPTPTPTPTTTSQFDFTSSSSLTVLVNRDRGLDPVDYAPANLVAMTDIGISSMNEHSLRAEAADAIVAMFAAAEAQGIILDMTSGYRDAGLQQQLYDRAVETDGPDYAKQYVAPAGHSEHQTGLAADISAPDQEPDCILDTCFGQTQAGQWLAAHAGEYGFILRYPEGLAGTTGYEYEPWHFRFIGVDAAAAYAASGATTYEEFVAASTTP
ncbi:M15 family metallopeptidase [Gulosibacter macacae]|uniref:M15 family metallopeptidase n=1 Tax=Gulosibacter macacae TaxID=2488791 RepID=UPI00163966D5|nr:M15 family metallopeptidase [Gulosibacter macacae]